MGRWKTQQEGKRKEEGKLSKSEGDGKREDKGKVVVSVLRECGH